MSGRKQQTIDGIRESCYFLLRSLIECDQSGRWIKFSNQLKSGFGERISLITPCLGPACKQNVLLVFL
jgi:hypothetical protein